VLARIAPGNLGLLNSGSWNAKLRPSACPALLLDGQTVAMRLPEAVVIYRYDSATESWKPGERFAFSRELEKDLYALVL